MSWAPPFLQNFWVHAFSVIADTHAKLFVIVSHLSFDPACARVPKGISQQFHCNSVNLVLQNRRQTLSLTLYSEGKSRGNTVGIPCGLQFFASGHQQRTQVGVADAKLAVRPGGGGDLLRREVGEADRDVHRGDDQLRDLLEPADVERIIVI